MKTVGLILLLLCSIMCGIIIASKKRTEYRMLCKDYDMLLEIKSLLRFNQPDKADLYDELRRKGYSDSLEGKRNELLDGYLLRLGTRDLKSELEAVAQCIERYEDIVKKSEKDTAEKCKFSVCAGVLIGTFLVVMLV